LTFFPTYEGHRVLQMFNRLFSICSSIARVKKITD
jgi:hypothetical protein